MQSAVGLDHQLRFRLAVVATLVAVDLGCFAGARALRQTIPCSPIKGNADLSEVILMGLVDVRFDFCITSRSVDAQQSVAATV